MIRLSITSFLIVLAAFSQSAAAQNHEQNFDYQPPPMFGDQEADGGAVKQFPVDVKTIESTATPPAVPEEPVYVETPLDSNTPPIPKRRPAKFKASPELLQEVMEERHDEETESASESERKIVRAEKVKKGELSATPTVIPPEKPDMARITDIQPQAGDMRDITADPLEGLLVSPSVEEVWSHLEQANKPSPPTASPQPRDITTRIQANETPVRMVAVRPVEELDKVRIREKPERVKEASLPANRLDEEAKDNDMVVSLSFEGGASGLNETDKQMLMRLLPMLQEKPELRVQIQAFAATHDEGQSAARRLSLLRAIAIREFLIEHNLDPQRIDLRALGTHAESGPLDRADVLLVEKGQTL